MKDIKFRRVDENDLERLTGLKLETYNSTHTIAFVNSINQKKWLESVSENSHCPRNLVLMATGKYLDEESKKYYDGEFGIFKLLNIDWQNRKADAGWDVFHWHRNKGYGKTLVKAGVHFAFYTMNLRRLNAEILVTNEPSIKCAEYAGFKQEGLQKEAIYKNGNYVDNLLYGVTK
jgi:RimJ/RimL family protein N-acetyltransferase